MSEEKVKKEKKIKIELKLKKKHPKKQFRIGSVVVKGYVYKQYELSEAEHKEFLSKGVQSWVVSKEIEIEEKVKVKKQEKVEG